MCINNIFRNKTRGFLRFLPFVRKWVFVSQQMKKWPFYEVNFFVIRSCKVLKILKFYADFKAQTYFFEQMHLKTVVN
jgi:hypothetical protein